MLKSGKNNKTRVLLKPSQFAGEEGAVPVSSWVGRAERDRWQ